MLRVETLWAVGMKSCLSCPNLFNTHTLQAMLCSHEYQDDGAVLSAGPVDGHASQQLHVRSKGRVGLHSLLDYSTAPPFLRTPMDGQPAIALPRARSEPVKVCGTPTMASLFSKRLDTPMIRLCACVVVDRHPCRCACPCAFTVARSDSNSVIQTATENDDNVRFTVQHVPGSEGLKMLQ
jgi:hypothetical protein